jgi:hypothetical protein
MVAFALRTVPHSDESECCDRAALCVLSTPPNSLIGGVATASRSPRMTVHSERRCTLCWSRTVSCSGSSAIIRRVATCRIVENKHEHSDTVSGVCRNVSLSEHDAASESDPLRSLVEGARCRSARVTATRAADEAGCNTHFPLSLHCRHCSPSRGHRTKQNTQEC